HGHQLSSDASIGIAIAPRDGSDLFDLLKNADLAMYAAKAAGRRTYRFFDPAMEQQANHRRELEADLRAALAQGAFELHYQPQVAAVVSETGLDPRRLELEITEAVLIADDDAALATLNQLRALGVHIALDDFGTGYSSLQYLQRFPFDKIKIDRSFVKEVTRNSSSASIIRAVVSIAADRNMVTTAEGVETQQQRETVQNLG